VSFNTAIQDASPEELRGRVAGSAMAGISASQVVSVAAGALVGLVAPYSVLLVVVGVGCVVGASVMLAARSGTRRVTASA
jgi:hypothetical protein